MADDSSFSSFESTLDELESLFELATEFVRGLKDLKNEEKLKFYGLFKQATEGSCSKRKPPIWDMKGVAKWEAWKGLGQMSAEDAMKNYINELTRINGNWEQCLGVTQNISEEQSKKNEGGLGLTVSTLYNTEYEEDCKMKDEDKTVFDWCKEGNITKMTKFFENNQTEANVKDDQGMTLLHWACDRGHQNIVNYLIKSKCDINSQVDPLIAWKEVYAFDFLSMKDNEGQTPLHYAVICEFESIAKTLLSAGAKANLRDNEGNLPSDLTSQATFREMLSAR